MPRPDAPPTDRGPRVRPRPRRRRRGRLAAAALLLLGAGWLADSLSRALAAPGTDSVAARVAEWGRLHHLGTVVNALERVQYDLHPPRTGGTPRGGVPRLATAAPRPVRAGPAALPAPRRLTPLDTPALAGEGQWQPVATVGGAPAVEVTYLRPDRAHSSYLTGLMWIDPRLVTFTLHPGTAVPGGTGWSEPPDIPPQARASLLATFNSGFTLPDSRGGYYQDGRTVQALRRGAASLVVSRDGSLSLGAWGSEVAMSAGVEAVRQNLDLLIDHGRVAPDINVNNTPAWGFTLGNRLFVFRSGIGVTADGAVVYAAGNALSTATLAATLARAGALRAMELDINPEWVSAMFYTHPAAGVTRAHLLTADEQRPPDRYFSVSSRDFFSVQARPFSAGARP